MPIMSPGQASSTVSRSIETFISKGGKDAALEKLKPNLKPGSPEFQPPRRPYQIVNLPSELSPDSDLPTIADSLKPYLLGQKQVEFNGQPISLSAAILDPGDIESKNIRPQTDH